MKRTKYTDNKIVNNEMYLYDAFGIFVTKTKIDKDDIEKVKQYKWHLNKSKGYVMSWKIGALHRFLMNTPKGKVTDHINTDKLDNRKKNLRVCTNQQNLFNSRVKGYYWSKEKNRWYSRIMLNRKTINLGYFNNQKEAQQARRKAELRYFGEFAHTN